MTYTKSSTRRLSNAYLRFSLKLRHFRFLFIGHYDDVYHPHHTRVVVMTNSPFLNCKSSSTTTYEELQDLHDEV